MSQGNIEAFRRAVDARNRGDTTGFLEEIDPKVEWHPGIAARLKGRETVYHGHDGVREWLRDLDEVFAEIPLEVEDIRDLGDRVIAFGHVRGHGAKSGAEIASPVAYIVKFKGAKMTLVHTYLNHDEALEAAGLSDHASEENLELAHRAVDAFNRRDFGAFLRLNDPGVEFSTRILELDGRGPYRGHDGIRGWWEEVLGFSPDLKTEIMDARCVGDITVARHRNHGHGIVSNAPMEQPSWQVSEWRSGKAIWWRIVASEAEALKAAGSRQ